MLDFAVKHLSGTGDSQRDSRESFAIDTPIFIARQADSPESLEFPIRANHPICANPKFARIAPLSKALLEGASENFQIREASSFSGTFRGIFCLRVGADLWEGDATKHFSVKKRGFQWKRGGGIHE